MALEKSDCFLITLNPPLSHRTQLVIESKLQSLHNAFQTQTCGLWHKLLYLFTCGTFCWWGGVWLLGHGLCYLRYTYWGRLLASSIEIPQLLAVVFTL